MVGRVLLITCDFLPLTRITDGLLVLDFIVYGLILSHTLYLERAEHLSSHLWSNCHLLIISKCLFLKWGQEQVLMLFLASVVITFG